MSSTDDVIARARETLDRTSELIDDIADTEAERKRPS